MRALSPKGNTMKNRYIASFEAAQIAEKQIPQFKAGDTVRLGVEIKEGEKKRIQLFEGIVIGVSGYMLLAFPYNIELAVVGLIIIIIANGIVKGISFLLSKNLILRFNNPLNELSTPYKSIKNIK